MRRSVPRAAWIAVSLIASAGCREELGAEKFPGTRVEGSVTVGGQPVKSGWIEFNPTGATVGNLRTAPIRQDGTYSVDHVPLGRVEISLADLKSPPISTELGRVGPWIFRFPTSPIRREIPAGEKTRVDLDLASEALVYQKATIEEKRIRNAASQ